MSKSSTKKSSEIVLLAIRYSDALMSAKYLRHLIDKYGADLIPYVTVFNFKMKILRLHFLTKLFVVMIYAHYA